MLYFAMVIEGEFQRAAFFDTGIFPVDRLPPGAARITAEKHSALLAGQAAGLTIAADGKGKPRLIAPAPTRSALIAAIKREAAARILSISPAWQQANDLRAFLDTTGGETFVSLADALARFARIDAIRAASNLIEDQLATTPDRSLRSFPITENPLWPEYDSAAQEEQV